MATEQNPKGSTPAANHPWRSGIESRDGSNANREAQKERCKRAREGTKKDEDDT